MVRVLVEWKIKRSAAFLPSQAQKHTSLRFPAQMAALSTSQHFTTTSPAPHFGLSTCTTETGWRKRVKTMKCLTLHRLLHLTTPERGLHHSALARPQHSAQDVRVDE
ncbi:hypothetical protein E2C01_069096 [Portunus trituberculatus]|uniref:Uncharacterized protein n=1 Tax=Portunus trituberculatus TaxID=210409 RepID=A0A5B7HTQ5_PORTR|nr:hypothetical protein [Portunus trituberculatus]